MDLVISTTTWWGNHPSIAYYADVNTTYFYTTNEVINELKSLKGNECLILEKNDEKIIPERANYQIGENKTYLLLQAR